ncbi:MAG: hypothetical protein A2176_11950 [Spirochaetes bacterium RBG_13_51_14]|nr:MAG: hypothetical protein A2176_11950 [Spirochaetes bacterium RBG_13_51_14]
MNTLSNISELRIGLSGLIRASAIIVLSGLLVSCAFGDEDAVQSLFGDSEEPLFVAVGTMSGNYALYGSPVGSVWSGNLLPGAGGGTLYSAVYGKDMLIAVGTSPDYFFSLDGLLWIRASTGPAVTIYSAVAGMGRFVAVGDESGTAVIYSSEDGFIWARNLLAAYSESLRGVAYGNDLFAAVGTGSLIVASRDGAIWSLNVGTPVGAGVNLNDVAYGNGMFVAVGDNGSATVSRDGIVWSRAFFIGMAGGNLSGIVYGSGKFVAVGTGGTGAAIYISRDGLAWSANVYRGSAAGFQDVTFSHGAFVAVGNGGQVVYSLDGLQWQTNSLPGSPDLYGITCRP